MIESAKKSFYKQGFMNTLGAKLISIKKGKTLVFCEGVVSNESEDTISATMQATMICLKPEN